jgi:hypothetical protein
MARSKEEELKIEELKIEELTIEELKIEGAGFGDLCQGLSFVLSK